MVSGTTISYKVFDYALKIFVVVSTFFYLPVASDLETFQKIEMGYQHQELFFRYGVITLFALSLFQTPRRLVTLKPMAVFVACLIGVSVFLNFDLQSRRSILNIAIGILFYKVVVEYCDLSAIKKYAAWLYWLLAFNLGLCLLQELHLDPLFQHVNPVLMPDPEPIGLMRLRATLGNLSVIITPLCFLIHPILSIMALPLLYYSQSSASVLAYVIVMSFLLYYRINRKLWYSIWAILILGAVSYVVFFDMPSGNFHYRYFVWFETFSHALKVSPFFGLGIGKFAAWNPMTTQGKTNPELLSWIWAHNEYLQVFFELGILGLAILFCYIKGIFKRFNTISFDREAQALFACFLGIMIISFFHFPFHTARMAGICLFLMALFHAKTIERQTIEGI